MKKIEGILGSPQEIFWKIGIILFANILGAITINLFYIPNHFLSGGVGGISILIYSLTKFPVGVSMFLFNVPMAYLGYRFLNRKFAVYSIISAFSLSFFVYMTRGLNQYHILDDVLLCSLFGGFINGFSMGLLFRNELSQGGIDFIAKIMKENYNVNIGTALLGMNIIIVSLGAMLFGLTRALYTIIAMRVSYIIVDRVQMGLDTRKQLIIITSKSKEVAGAVMQEMHRGVTYLHGEGGYTGSEKEILYCVVKNSEIMKIKKVIFREDNEAFVSISDAVEVQGNGFTTKKVQ